MAKGLVSALVASSKAIDPTLDALFSQSAGAVKTPPKSRYAELLPRRASPPADEDEQDEDEDEELSEVTDDSEDESEEESGAKINAGDSDDDDDMAEEDGSEDEDNGDASSGDDEAEAAEVLERAASRKTAQDEGRKRKRKQRDDDEDLEANYLERLANEEEPSGKRRKGDSGPKAEGPETAKDGEASSAEKEDDDESGGDVPVHESLAAGPAASELEKANRTVFLSNVSVEAITSRKAKKTLLNHLSSVLDKKADPPQKVQSIRFRSTAFETAGIPKRAAYIKKSVMEATTKSTNAYVVYSTNAAARLAVSQLNGTVVLDRHLRVDSVAHPAPVDHRRCVFVGNLGFVDDETVYNTKLNEEGKEVTEKRKRTKTPMDVEEGLWRVFGEKAGKVESVRVVRDPATRVGKGIAYVQFYDGNAVESAILLNGKKFPPMLPRELRVSRCKAPHKTARAMEARRERTAALSGAADRKGGKKGKKTDDGESGKYVPKPTAEAQTLAGRASKLLGRFGAAQLVGKPPGKDKKHRDRRNRGMNRDGNRSGSGSRGPAAAGPGGGGVGEKSGFKAPEQFVFEGRRASARDGKPKDLKFRTKGKGKGKDKVHKKKKAGKAGK